MADNKQKAKQAILDLDPEEVAAEGGTLAEAIEMVLNEHSIPAGSRKGVLQAALDDPSVEIE